MSMFLSARMFER